MNSSPTNLRTRAHGFTLVELLVSTGLVGVVGLVLVSVLVGTMQLSSQNVVTNVSNFRSRQILDRIGNLVRFALDTPVLIKADGTAATGTAADGLLIKKTLGGSYAFKNANGQADADIPSGATSFMVEYAPAAGSGPPVAGDHFVLGLSTQPSLQVATVGTATGNSTLSKVSITTTQALPEVAKPGSYTVFAARFQKEAYVFVQSGTRWDLRHYAKVTATTNFSSAANFTVVGSGFQKLGTQAWFTAVTAGETRYVWLRAIGRSSNHAEYVETISGRNTLTSMPIQIKLWNYTAPPPP